MKTPAFIAFVGEKKAGKSSLLKAITGVPLPTAVRECTAAVCMIQLGLDWHHLAQMDSGESQVEALDDSQERRVLRLAKRKDKEAAEHALEQIETAEQAHFKAKQVLEAQEGQVKSVSTKLARYERSLQEQQDNLPFMWDFVKNFGMVSSQTQKDPKNMDQTAEDIEHTRQQLEQANARVAAQRLEADTLASVNSNTMERSKRSSIHQQTTGARSKTW